MWEALISLGVALVGGFITLGIMLGRLGSSVEDIKDNHLTHIYESLNTIQSVLMKRD